MQGADSQEALGRQVRGHDGGGSPAYGLFGEGFQGDEAVREGEEEGTRKDEPPGVFPAAEEPRKAAENQEHQHHPVHAHGDEEVPFHTYTVHESGYQAAQDWRPKSEM